jgi:hypothetical protein
MTKSTCFQLALLSMALFTGCEIPTHEPPAADYLGEDAATVVVIRSGFIPVGFRATVSCDGTPLCTLGENEYALVKVRPGQRKFRVAMSALASTLPMKATIECSAHGESYIFVGSGLKLQEPDGSSRELHGFVEVPREVAVSAMVTLRRAR